MLTRGVSVLSCFPLFLLCFLGGLQEWSAPFTGGPKEMGASSEEGGRGCMALDGATLIHAHALDDGAGALAFYLWVTLPSTAPSPCLALRCFACALALAGLSSLARPSRFGSLDCFCGLLSRCLEVSSLFSFSSVFSWVEGCQEAVGAESRGAPGAELRKKHGLIRAERVPRFR